MADDADNAQTAIDSAIRMALSRARVQELPANDDLDCAKCGELIGEARKAAMPSARLCIVCERERSSKR